MKSNMRAYFAQETILGEYPRISWWKYKTFSAFRRVLPDLLMEQFTEEHAKLLLSKEWMAKADAGKATPYLLKFHYSPQDLSCCILVTDTKSVWTEVLNSKQMARRWRTCNALSPGPFPKTGDEDTWREQTLELLSQAHTIGGFAELSFEIVDSTYSDLAMEFECEAFKWRWEICFLGHKWASEIISKHLIFPLISLNHLTFSSADVVGEIPDGDIEKTVDKLGRTARRTLDTHIKNAMSKPRIATMIRRITAMFNFVPDLPPVASAIGKVELKIDQYEPEKRAPPRIAREEEKRNSSPKPIPERAASKRERSVEMKNAEPASSETEESDAEPPPAVTSKHAISSAVAGPSRTAQGSPMPERHVDTPPPASKPNAEPSDSDSSPHRPVKKAKSKAPTSSDEDSEQDIKTKSARGASAGGIKRGARQPLKRGGKRF
ncbi:unnamed protein product [Cyclocybe aegerita]|uniref:XLF-like N-terminal domain-containing protein n=1 Tax=Cyclocybe aegerita TaxID=1973307 RepID=A0A8S0W259_CYCAE|nr:unnamed protein product [Cyclocybe aegerita]